MFRFLCVSIVAMLSCVIVYGQTYNSTTIAPSTGVLDAKLASDGTVVLLKNGSLQVKLLNNTVTSSPAPAGAVKLTQPRNGTVYLNGEKSGKQYSWSANLGGIPAVVEYWPGGHIVGISTTTGPVGISTSGCLVNGFTTEPTPCNVCVAGPCFSQDALDNCLFNSANCGIIVSSVLNWYCDPNGGGFPGGFDPNWRRPTGQIGCVPGGSIKSNVWVFGTGIVIAQWNPGVWRAFPAGAPAYDTSINSPLVAFADGSGGLTTIGITWQAFDAANLAMTNGDVWWQTGGTNVRPDRYGQVIGQKFRPVATNGFDDLGWLVDFNTLSFKPNVFINRNKFVDISSQIDVPLAINEQGKILGIKGTNYVLLSH